jgi:hypothetical protein
MPDAAARPYIIFRTNKAGYWSNFSVVLQGLDHADTHGLIPVVDMERYPTLYSEEGEEAAAELGTRNGWEYYFEQPGGLTLEQALERDPLDSGGNVEGPFVEFLSTAHAEETITRGRELVRKYVRVKPEILAQVDAVLAPGNHPEVLGVHVRGTDMRAGKCWGHPIPAPTEAYIEQARQLDAVHGFQRVFLACDEDETVTRFREVFGERLLTTGAHRTSTAVEVTNDYQWLFGAKRERHKYLLGLEVLLDGLLLSRCGHLLSGASNVPRCAMYFADEAQVRHPMPSVWLVPTRYENSVGREFLATLPPPTHAPTPVAVRAHIEELERILEYTENGRAKAMDSRYKLNRYVEDLEARLAAQKEELAAARKTVGAQKKVIDRLQKRLLKAITSWTKLGWFLAPKSRPEWRKNPLEGCEVE